MGRVLTNFTSFKFSPETSLSVGGNFWKELDLDSINNMGANITVESRNPMDAERQRIKGTITGLESSFEFTHDLTMGVFEDFIGGFCYAALKNNDTDLRVTAADADDGYSVTKLDGSSATDAHFAEEYSFSSNNYFTLVYVTGMENSANNGLKVQTADYSAGIIDTPPLTTESSAPATALLQHAGWSFASNQVSDISRSGDTLTMTFLAESATAMKRRLNVGQTIHFGSS